MVGIVIGSVVGGILLLGLVIFILSQSRDRKGFHAGRGRGVEMTDHSEHDTHY
jgi:hypothetical protein